MLEDQGSMDLSQIEYFVAVAKLNHMTRAAKKLHVTQPTLTASIHKLEQELGTPLFERVGRNIYLNRYGKEFLSYAEEAISALNRGVQSVLDMKSTAADSVTLISPSMRAFPGLLEQLLKCCVNVSILDYGDHPEEILDNLLKGSADLYLSSHHINNDSFNYDLLTREERVLLTNASRPFAEKSSVNVSDLTSAHFASFKKGRGPRKELEDIFARYGSVPRVTYECMSLVDIANAVSTGAYVAIITEHSARALSKDNPALTYIHLDADDDLRILERCLYYRPNALDRIPVQKIRAVLLDYFSNQY